MNAGVTSNYSPALRVVEQQVRDLAQHVVLGIDIAMPAEPKATELPADDRYGDKPAFKPVKRAIPSFSGLGAAIVTGAAALFAVDPKKFAATGFPGMYVPLVALPGVAGGETALEALGQSYGTQADVVASMLSTLVQHLPESARAVHAERLAAMSSSIATVREAALAMRVPGGQQAADLRAAQAQLRRLTTTM